MAEATKPERPAHPGNATRVWGDAVAEVSVRMPYSTEAEHAVIGGVLLDPLAWPRVEHLPAEAFFHPQHVGLWQVLRQMAEQGRDLEFFAVHHASGVEMSYLNAMVQSVPSAASIHRYAGIVHDLHVRRRLVGVCRAAMGLAADPESGMQADAVIDRITSDLLALQQGAADHEPRAVVDLMKPWLEDLEARASGLSDAMPTGLVDLDRLLGGGLRRGEVFVIGARPSMGKTALILALARNIGESVPVLMCSMEDSERMLIARHVAAAGRVNLADLRAPDRAGDGMWHGVVDGVDRVRNLRLWVDDMPAMTLAEVRRKARQVQARDRELGVVVVDYLQLMEGEAAENRAYELNAIVRGMKRMAKELGVAVVVTSQLSREADKIEGPPGLHHLAESGGIEQAADIVGLLWRAARRRPNEANKHDAQIEIAKHKNGATDTVHLYFDGATQRFESTIAGAV